MNKVNVNNCIFVLSSNVEHMFNNIVSCKFKPQSLLVSVQRSRM